MEQKKKKKFNKELTKQGFNAHDLKVVLAILEGNNNYNQEDVIQLSNHNCKLLRKLGWLRKVKNAIRNSEFKMTYIDSKN